MSPDLTTSDEVCIDPRDPDALMHAAYDDRNLFHWGVLVSAAGRLIVVRLMRRGYGRGIAMRIALQAEEDDR